VRWRVAEVAYEAWHPVAMRAVSANFGFARQNRPGNTTCRYEGTGFEDRTAAQFAVDCAGSLAELTAEEASTSLVHYCRGAIEHAELQSSQSRVGGCADDGPMVSGHGSRQGGTARFG